jgi:hypothetical protein
MDLLTLVKQMSGDGAFVRIAQNPVTQFQVPKRRYFGAELLPEKMVDENAFTEDQVKFRTIVATDGTRYSPAQKKAGDLFGTVKVELGHSDIARELTGREYDALIKLLGGGSDMAAMEKVIHWADTVLNLALVEKNERDRWQAIINGQVVRQGDNSFVETVSFPNPVDHRVAAANLWSDDAYDPFDDIFAGADLLDSKGYAVSRIIGSRRVTGIMAKNEKVRSRTGHLSVDTSGSIRMMGGRADLAAINAVLQSGEGLPGIEPYTLRYRTETGDVPFVRNDCLVMVATTGRDQNVDMGDGQSIPITDTLGYCAIGRAVGQSKPGRVVTVEPKTNKPPRLEGEAYQTSFPVITEPEAFFVITNIN